MRLCDDTVDSRDTQRVHIHCVISARCGRGVERQMGSDLRIATHAFGCGTPRNSASRHGYSARPRCSCSPSRRSAFNTSLTVVHHLGRHPPPHVCKGEKFHYHLAAPPVGQEASALPPSLALPCLLAHLRPQDLHLRLPLGALCEEVIPRLRPVPAPPALRGGPDFVRWWR